MNKLFIVALSLVSLTATAQVIKSSGKKVVIKDQLQLNYNVGNKVLFKNSMGQNQGIGTITKTKNNLALIVLQEGQATDIYRIIASTEVQSSQVITQKKTASTRFGVNVAFENRTAQEIKTEGEVAKRDEIKSADDFASMSDILDHKSVEILGEAEFQLNNGFSTSTMIGASFSPNNESISYTDGPVTAKIENKFFEPKIMQKLSYTTELNNIKVKPFALIGAGLYSNTMTLTVDAPGFTDVSEVIETKVTGRTLYLGAGTQVSINENMSVFAQYKVDKVSNLEAETDGVKDEDDNSSSDYLQHSTLSLGLNYMF
ncbi:MAG: hypothetical protein BM556_02035 [Bacteriovorax sp. MedPE-SWde]|nr:MAG: hypothetical protein BM556_02035 [Bacteriovorax sp. MedPE-SWde]